MDETDGWTAIAAASELLEGKPIRVGVDDVEVLLVRGGETIFAIGNRCTHQGAPLDRGVLKIQGSLATATCPAHGSMFGLLDGRVLRGPATTPVPAFEARIANDMVQVRRRAG